MDFLNYLDKLAELAVNVGVNVQKGQTVVLRSPTDAKELARLIVEKAYLRGAKTVIVEWNDSYNARQSYLHMDVEDLKEVPEHVTSKNRYYVENGACFISITSPVPGLHHDVDAMKVQDRKSVV